MAAPGGKYFIGDDELKRAHPHHASFQQLWETKWQMPASMGVYPFMFGYKKDFEPIVANMVQSNAAFQKGMKEPYDWDAYAEMFFPKAEELAHEAVLAEDQEKLFLASELYFLREHPITEIVIPHTHGTYSDGPSLYTYVHIPFTASPVSPAPLVIIVTGLDGYRTELAVWIESFRQVGCACMIVEIPGTGDNPGDPKDPTSPDRVWNSMFDWVRKQMSIDQTRICVWGFSTGGYYSQRMAHTHANKLKGAISLGGGCHHMFDMEWLNWVNHKEYPFDLANSLAHKWGYGDDTEKFKEEASQKFSLVHDGTLDRGGCCRTLIVNGSEDSIFPVDDAYVAISHGDPKEVRIVPGKPHMGEPESFSIVLTWIYKLFGIRANPVDQIKTLPFKPKYSL
ncbi:MAG: hypothetical protein M1831_001207 [Alyxoria varia]|nr:MAG: hypothetical protein M1831_001207 [Alyxoria varia]